MKKRILSLVLAILMLGSMLPVASVSVAAEGYYTDSDLTNIRCTILSNTVKANYVNALMRYHILSATDNYRVARNLENGSNVVFFFDGCSDNMDSSIYSNYNNYHLSAYCAVVKKVNGVLKIIYESEHCSTIPDNPRNPSLNDGTAVPTVLDGVYNIISTNHLSRYAALHIQDNSGSASVLRCTGTTSYLSTSTGINIHARSNFSGAPTNGVCSTSYSSTGCFLVGLTNNTWSEYNNFIYQVLGVSNAIRTTPYSSGSWTKCSAGIDKGLVIVDRYNYKDALAGIYGGDNNRTANALVATLTSYTDNLDYWNHDTHTFTGTNYESAHPHKEYKACICGEKEYTGNTGTSSSCPDCLYTPDPKYEALKGMKAYPVATANFEVKTVDLTTRAGDIYVEDFCTVNQFYTNGWCQVTYPLASGATRVAYTPISNFVYDTSYDIYTHVTTAQTSVYAYKECAVDVRWWTGTNDTIYVIGETDSAYQICYPIDASYGGGYKAGWVPKSAGEIKPPVTITDVKIESLPSKLNYMLGDELDTTGFALKVSYDNNTSEIITSGINFTGFDSNKSGKKVITAEYEGKTVTFEVNVSAPQIIVSSASGVNGETVDVNVCFANNPGVMSAMLNVNYDKTALKLVKVTDEGKLGTFYHSDNYTSPYILSWGNDTDSINNSYNGKVVTLTFEILKETEGESEITVSYDNSNYEIIDKDLNPVYFETVSGKVSISKAIKGDVNSDKILDSADLVTLRKIVVNAITSGEYNPELIDVNNDGTFDVRDIVRLKRILAGIEF